MLFACRSENAIISLLSGTQAPRTDEEGEGTGEVETEKNSKHRTARRRHQRGSLCRETGPGWRAEGSAAVEVGGGSGCSVAGFHEELRESGSVLRVEPSALQDRAPLVLAISEQRLDGQLS